MPARLMSVTVGAWREIDRRATPRAEEATLGRDPGAPAFRPTRSTPEENTIAWQPCPVNRYKVGKSVRKALTLV
jgi:hypothetical protein